MCICQYLPQNLISVQLVHSNTKRKRFALTNQTDKTLDVYLFYAKSNRSTQSYASSVSRTNTHYHSSRFGQHSGHASSPLLSARGRGWTSYQIFKNGGLYRTSTLRGGLLEKRGWLFSGGQGCNFYTKKNNNLNLKYLTTKKVYKQKYFSLP